MAESRVLGHYSLVLFNLGSNEVQLLCYFRGLVAETRLHWEYMSAIQNTTSSSNDRVIVGVATDIMSQQLSTHNQIGIIEPREYHQKLDKTL